MVLNDLGNKGDALLHRDIRQAQKPCVGDFVNIDQFAEVSVDRNQNPVRRLREFQQRPVPGILTERSAFEDIVPSVP